MLKKYKFYSVSLVLLIGFFLYACDQEKPTSNKAKYVFYFIGDGMGIQHVNATQVYLAAINDKKENQHLNFTSFPVTGFSTTYAANRYITGSAAAGTALATGTKTSINTLGLSADHSDTLYSIAHYANKAGFQVGVTTSVSVDHATPAAFYAHQPQRNMYHEVAHDLINSGFRFYAGGGFIDPLGLKSKNPLGDVFEKGLEKGYCFIQDLTIPDTLLNQYKSIVYTTPNPDGGASLKYRIDRDAADVTLANITSLAIDVLMNPKGFFLMVEGGKIDWACHHNDAAATIGEMICFSDAIEVALEFYKKYPNETLIVVTSDHETGGMSLGNRLMQYEINISLLSNQKASLEKFNKKAISFKDNHNQKPSFNAYLQFITDELGLDVKSINGVQISNLQKAYSASLSQIDPLLNGINSEEYGSFDPLSVAAIQLLNQMAGIGWTSFSHTGSQVPVYTIGIGQELFTGQMDNTDIPIRIAKAMGISME
jgi:alkaline phosphatase